MSKKFWKFVYRILYTWVAIGIALIVLGISILVKEGGEGFKSLWYGQTIATASGVWIGVLILTLFYVIGIRAYSNNL